MERDAFPNCCGISVLTDLSLNTNEVWDHTIPNDLAYGGKGAYRPRTKADDIAELVDYLLEAKSEKEGLVLAVTNRKAPQKRAAKLLQEFGFKALRKFRNPRHHSILTMWQLTIGKLTVAQIKKKAKDLSK